MLALFGWRAEGDLDDTPRCVMIAAPHTTNWDFVFMLAIAFALRIHIAWMGKDTLFKGPLGGFMRWTGGISIDRSKRGDVVGEMVARLKAADALILTVPAEGTRRKTRYWKSGFYHIARGAQVPIVLGYLDYARKAGGIGPRVMPTDDLEADVAKIRAFYANIPGKYPEQFCNIEFAPPRDDA